MDWIIGHLLAIDWATVAKTVLGAGIGSGLVQGWFSARSARRQRTARATYLAMRLAVLLDAFGVACAEMISRNASAPTPPAEKYPDWEGLPELPPYPEDSDGWTSLRSTLAIRCLRFRSSIQESETLLRWVRDFDDDQLGDTLNQQSAQLGVEARRLAEDLHREYRLGSISGDYPAQLQTKLTQANEAIQAERRRHQEAWEEILAAHSRHPSPGQSPG